MRRVGNQARYVRVMFNRTTADVEIDEADFQQLSDELTAAKNNLVQHNGYMPRHCVFGPAPRVPGHVLVDKADLPLLELEDWFRKQAQHIHKRWMAAIEVEANTKIRQSLFGRSRPMSGDMIRCTTGEQVKESISRNATSSVQKHVRMASPAEWQKREMTLRLGADDPDSRKTLDHHRRTRSG